MDFTVNNLPRPGRWMVMLCFAGISIAIFLLHRDYSARVSARKGAPIGVLEETHSDVRVRPATSYVWMPAEAGTQLFQNDAVQTGVRGKARIRLTTGTTFSLEERTMVILDEQLAAKKKDEKRNSVGHWAEPSEEALSSSEVRSPFQKPKPRAPANQP